MKNNVEQMREWMNSLNEGKVNEGDDANLTYTKRAHAFQKIITSTSDEQMVRSLSQRIASAFAQILQGIEDGTLDMRKTLTHLQKLDGVDL